MKTMLTVWLLAATAFPTPCDVALEAPMEVPSLDPNAWYGSLYDWAGGYEDAPLGMGRLKLENREDIWDWWHRIEIPLYRAPEGVHWGWYVNGWLVAEEDATPMGTSGMIETGYETMSFIVLEHRRDGWLRLRYGKPSDSHDGVAWTHTCHVETEGLGFESWEERFTSGEISPLTFRSPVPHALRAGPGASSDLLHWIAGDHHLEPLEFRGDWMRVRVTQPSDYCAGEAIQTREHEGWVRWRSPDKGPWVWYYTRGC